MTVATKLLKALQAIERTGSFQAAGSVSDAVPGLEIDGFGPVGFPFNAVQAEAVRKLCRQAPYGQGEKTLVDTSVRHVWVLDPDRFRLADPRWPKTLAGIVTKVQADLGLEKEKVEAHLYNLLLYEPGSFFLPHRDGERLDRMVATLVIVLPCSFAGGELVVRHEGQEKILDFGAGQPNLDNTLHYGAFYADCEHEVRPLTEGHRLCLVYNLTLTKRKKALLAPSHSADIEAVTRVLQTWTPQQEPTKLALALEHQYSQKGLTWDALKGVDRTRALILAAAARQADCVVHLALVTLWESGEGEEDEDRWGSRRSRYTRFKVEENEDSPASGESGKIRRDAQGRALGQHQMVEVFDTSLTADHWRDPHGGQPALGAMPFKPEEIVPPEAVTAFTPEEVYTGFTGNEGSPLERWYHRAVLVVWPRRHHYGVLASCGPADALRGLLPLLDEADQTAGSERERLRADCRAFAAGLLAAWGQRDRARDWKRRDEILDLLAPLVRLDDPDLVAAYLTHVLATDRAVVADERLLKLCEKHGWAPFRDGFRAVFAATRDETAVRNSKLLEDLATFPTRRKAARDDLAAGLVEPLLDGLATAARDTFPMYREKDQAPLITSLARALVAIGQDAPFESFLRHLASLPKRYTLELQVAALREAGAGRKAIPAPMRTWIATCQEALRARTVTMPTPPTDQRRSATFHCKCAECTALRNFLQDPAAREHSFARNEKVRRHIVDSICGGACDVTTTLDQRRRPMVLHLMKNQASYEASLKRYHEDCERLVALEALLEPAPKKASRKKPK